MSKKMSNTKQLLIEVSRQLFAKHGKKNVTMNDIAEASHKGRRTLYTYFNNKDEVYRAVIDSELGRLMERLEHISSLPIEPDIKLTNHIFSHLDTIKDIVTRNGSLRADFFMDIYEVERTRRKIDAREIELLKDILIEGIEKNIFKKLDVNLSSIILFYSIKGLEVPYIRQNISTEFERNRNRIIDFIFAGVKKPKDGF